MISDLIDALFRALGPPSYVSIDDVVPPCRTCIPQKVESHPHLKVVRCANCKQWLA